MQFIHFLSLDGLSCLPFYLLLFLSFTNDSSFEVSFTITVIMLLNSPSCESMLSGTEQDIVFLIDNGGDICQIPISS